MHGLLMKRMAAHLSFKVINVEIRFDSILNRTLELPFRPIILDWQILYVCI